MNKQITIFGGTGFLGRYIVNDLANQGYTIRIATRRAGAAYFLKTCGNVGQIVPFVCDIYDNHSIKNAVEGSYAVINLIGVLAEGRGQNKFSDIHHKFPQRLAQILKKNKIENFVHVSAIGANEQSTSKYLKTKFLGEKGIQKNLKSATIIRPSVIFGVEDNFFNRFARMAMISPFLPLIGGGQTKFQPVYVGDVAKAVVKSIESEETKGKVYELGGPDILTFKELLEKMLQHIERKRLLVPLPWRIAMIKGAVLQNLPGKLLTRDQVRALRYDSVVQEAALTLSDLDIDPTPMSQILPTYLERFKPGGRFGIQVKNS